MKIGDVIRHRREALHLTQVELASVARCSQQTIGKIELNLVRKPQNLPNIAKALKTNAEAILAEVTEDIAATTRSPSRAEKSKRKNRARWPFKFDFELYDRLEESEQLAIETLVFSKINDFEARNTAPAKSGKDRVLRRGDKSSPGA
jgi:transcriptional regulator with XRE-family HTH domain